MNARIAKGKAMITILQPKGVVGFTGTRNGMTPAQKITLKKIIKDCDVLHHGDCIGADFEANEISKSIGVLTKIHPPINPDFRAFCAGYFVFPQKSYQERNRDIVNAAPCLIATPKEQTEVSKGGTWQTVRYARKQGKRIVIIWPDGTTKEENPCAT